MKEELYLDFDLAHTNDVPALLETMSISSIAIALPPPWVTKALFSTGPNRASLKFAFPVSTFA